MRLTLRTLLAYMDDILDPADQEELARKIEASPFATELIHRSRDAVRRLRLSAPEVLAGESGDLHGGDNILDANTAAEYLDSVLTPDEVVEFERHCLEAGPNADMLLAEAASCHHILTLVLGEPAEVDADLRQRMYALARHASTPTLRVEPGHAAPVVQEIAAPPAATPAPVMAPAIVLPQRPAVDPDEASVPDYLLEAARSRRRSRRFVAALVFVGALLGSGLTVLLWPRGEKEVASEAPAWNSSSAADVGKTAETPPSEPEATLPTEPVILEDPTELAKEAGVDLPTPTDPAPLPPAASTAPDVEPSGMPLPDASLPPTSIPPAPGEIAGAAAQVTPAAPEETPVADATAPPSETAPPVASTTPPAASTSPTDASTPPADPAAPPAADPGASGTPTVTANMPPVAPQDPVAPPPVADATPPAGDLLAGVGTTAPPTETQPGLGESGADAGPVETEPAEPEAPQVLGAYLGLNNDLLLRFDPAAVPNPAWLRLPPRSNFIAGDRLLTLPTFRTHVVLNPDVNAYVAGGTEITLLNRADAGGDVNLALPYGRLILNSGPNGNRIALVMGDQTRVVTLSPSSSLAVEVVRQFLPGNDYESTPAPLQVSWYLTSGSAEWNDGATDVPGQSAEAPAMWTTDDGGDSLPQTIGELPPWIDKEPATTLEANARDVIAETVAAGQPVSDALLELTTNTTTGIGRRPEVRSLAARGASYVGQFEPLVKTLADTTLRNRGEQVVALRDAVARDPSNIARIGAAFELQRGANAAEDLTKMVVGFSPEEIGRTRDQVQDGALLRLLNWLDDEDLTYRVLANYNINEITGTKDLGGYRPDQLASKRQRAIQIYLRRFEAGDLMPRQ